MIKVLRDPKHFRQIQLVSVVISAIVIIKLQNHAKLSLLWVIISICAGLVIALYYRYQSKLRLPKYSIWLVPIFVLALLNTSISAQHIPLSVQALFFTFLGLNLSHRFLVPKKPNDNRHSSSSYKSYKMPLKPYTNLKGQP